MSDGLTARDREILVFINEHGFCEMPQLRKRFGFGIARSYQVMQRLMRKECIIHQRVFHNRPGIYTLTKKGAAYTTLRPLKNIPLDNYEHQVLITELYIKMREQYPARHWISERQLKHAKYKNGVGQAGHLPDGILVTENGEQIAIEVELSLKAKDRLLDIFKKYNSDYDYQEIWYFCARDIFLTMQEWAKEFPAIKIMNLDEVFA